MKSEKLSPSGAKIASCDVTEGCVAISCEICLKEIPADLTHSFEGPDYVHHFCGLDCLGKWHEQTKK